MSRTKKLTIADLCVGDVIALRDGSSWLIAYTVTDCTRHNHELPEMEVFNLDYTDEPYCIAWSPEGTGELVAIDHHDMEVITLIIRDGRAIAQ